MKDKEKVQGQRIADLWRQCADWAKLQTWKHHSRFRNGISQSNNSEVLMTKAKNMEACWEQPYVRAGAHTMSVIQKY